jgi:hypothetical protein
MPRTVKYSCSGCGKDKLATNHWFVITTAKSGFHLNTWTWAIQENVLDEEGTEYVCGHGCAHKLLGAFLGGSN